MVSDNLLSKTQIFSFFNHYFTTILVEMMYT